MASHALPVPDGAMSTLNIVNLSGKTVVSVEVPLTDTIGHVKHKIQAAHRQGFQQLLLESAVLGDNELVSSLPPNPTLTLVLQDFDKLACEALLTACRRGSFESATNALRALADPNCATPVTEATALLLASKSGCEDVVKLVCTAKANPDRGQELTTPLYAASSLGHMGAVKHLCEYDADMEIPNGNDHTPLMVAAYKGHLRIVRFLCKKGADTEKPMKNGNTPLHAAAAKGHANVVRSLCSASADKETRSLHLRTHSGQTPLYMAAEQGHVSVVRILCKESANPNQGEVKDGITPLMVAAHHHHVAVVKILCQFGADKEVVNKDGLTVLQLASLKGSVNVVQVLCDCGAKPGRASSDGMTALHLASAMAHAAAVGVLCHAKADVDKRERARGATPLFIASEKGHAEVVRVLCAAGANQDLATKNGSTPFYVARKRGHKAALACLEEAESDLQVVKRRRSEACARLMASFSA